MDSSQVPTILESLSSGKLKLRSQALDELTTLLKQDPASFPPKYLYSTIEALVDILEAEKIKYENLSAEGSASSDSKLTAAENRLSSASYVLRVLVQTTNSGFKPKHLKFLLLLLPDLMVFHGSNSLLPSTSTHLLCALESLVDCEVFQLKFEPLQWITLTKKLLSFLSIQLDSLMNNKNVMYLLSLLTSLLSLDCAFIEEVQAAFIDPLVKLLVKTESENSNTKALLQLINHYILKVHLVDYFGCSKLFEPTMRFLTRIGKLSTPGADYELSIFNIFLSKLLCHQIPTNQFPDNFDKEDLTQLFEDYLVVALTNYDPSHLGFADFQFRSLTKRIEWLEFDEFQLRPQSDVNQWLQVYSLSQMVKTYYTKFDKERPEESPLFKKPKVSQTFSSILRGSLSPASFIVRCVESSSKLNQLIGVQLSAFISATTNQESADINHIVESIIRKWEDIHMEGWILIALLPLISDNNSRISEKIVQKAFRLSIPLLKSTKLCQPACALLIVLVKHYKDFLLADAALVHQASDLYEESELNGPILLTDVAFAFWKHMHWFITSSKPELGESAHSKTASWLLSKASQLVLNRPDQSSFYAFTAWLAGISVAQTQERSFTQFIQWDYRYYPHWVNFSAERNFLLQETGPLTKIIKKPVEVIPVAASAQTISQVSALVISYIRASTKDVDLAYRWCCEGIKILNALAGVNRFADFSEELIHEIRSVLTELRELMKVPSTSSLFELAQVPMDGIYSEVLFSNINIKALSEKYKERLFNTSRKSHTANFSFFDGRKKIINFSTSVVKKGESSSRYCFSPIGAVVHLLSNIWRFSAGREEAEGFQEIGEFLDGLPERCVTDCLPTVIGILQASGQTKSLLKPLENITQKLGSSLLSAKFNTSNLSVTYLSLYLDAVRWSWMAGGSGLQEADCKDIFEWIISKLFENSFGGSQALCYFAKLLLNMLRYHDLSGGLIKGGKQRVFGTLVTCIQRLPPFAVVSALEGFGEYMARISANNQNIVFSELSETFRDSLSVERQVFHFMILSRIGSSSRPQLIKCALQILNIGRNSICAAYVKSSLEALAFSNKMKDTKELFHLLRFDVIDYWYESSISNQDSSFFSWGVSLFGFATVPEFLKQYSKEVSGTHFSKRIALSFVLQELINATGKDKKALLESSLHLSIPLSYISPDGPEQQIRTFKDTLGRRYNQLLKNLTQEIFYWTLYFTKWDCLEELKDASNELYPESGLSVAFFGRTSTMSKDFSKLRIAPFTSLSLLKAYILNYHLDERELNLLLARLSCELDMCPPASFRQLILRKIEAVLLLFESFLSKCEYLLLLAQVLAEYLKIPELDNDACDIIRSIITSGVESEDSTTEMYSAVFASLLAEQSLSNLGSSNMLVDSLSSAVASSETSYSGTWECCLKVLKGKRLEDNIYLKDELLRVDYATESRISLLSRLFDFHKEPTPFDPEFDFSPIVVRNLLRVSELEAETSSNFDLWKGYYVGGYYMKHTRLPSILTDCEVWGQPLSSKISPLECILNIIYEQSSTATDPESYLNLVSVVGFVYERISCLGPSLSGIDYSGKLSCISHAVRLSDCEFQLLHNRDLAFDDSHDLRGWHLQDPSNVLSYKIWLSTLLQSLSKELGGISSYFLAFQVLDEESTAFMESVSLGLFSLLYQADEKLGAATMLQFLKTFELSPESHNDDFKSKASFALHLFSFIRSKSREGNARLLKVYEGLNLECFFDLASKIGETKLAYMVFEECFHSLNSCDPHRLYSVFEGIKDEDLIRALPRDASLDAAVRSVSKFQPRSLKSFMFNNCKFDVDTIMRSNPDEEELIQSSNTNGFNGLAEILGGINRARHPTKKEEAYQWSIKLGKWDLAMPENHSTSAEVLYSLLKGTRSKSFEGLAAPRRLLKTVAHQSHLFLEKDQWASSLCAIITAELITSHSGAFPEHTRTMDIIDVFDQKAVENTSFLAHNLVMKSRQMFLNCLSGSCEASQSSLDMKVCEIKELIKYTRLAREAQHQQESLASAMLLDKKADILGGLLNNDYWKQCAIIEGAQALWLQGESDIATSMLETLLRDRIHLESNITAQREIHPQISSAQLKAILVEWTSSSRKENAHTIYREYIADSSSEMAAVSDFNDRADVFYRFGEFCYQQVKRLSADKTIDERRRRSVKGSEELSSLLEIIKDASVPDQDRLEAKKHYNKLKVQLAQDQDILSNLSKEFKLFTWKSLHFYLSTLVYSCQKDDVVLDKFCGLWFQYAEDGELNSKLYQEISSIPSFKFLPWVNQMTSRLSIESSPFQRTLQLTLKRVMFKLPNETLYPLISLRLYKRLQSAGDPSISARVKAVEKLFAELEKYDNGQFLTDYLDPIQEFCENCVDLACMKLSKSCRQLNLENLKSGNYWIRGIRKKGVSLPVKPVRITSSADGRKTRPTITHMDPIVEVSASGLSLPKIATFYLSDGTSHKVLLKGSNDDLRQDAIMEQVFKQVNQILIRNVLTRKHKLRIRTYEIVPLGPQAGLIEFVSNSTSLHEILRILHKHDDLPFVRARKMMKAVQSKSSEERVDVYREITKTIHPKLRQFFFNSFLDPQAWLDAKYTYTKGVVTTSIIGYVLGLGDRHLNNILLDTSTGEPVHIDFGVAFDQGKLLPIPELVPFRLTRDMVDGFGVTGVEGVFRKNFERVFSVLRADRERVMNVLNVLKWDPLYSWVVSPLRKRKLQVNMSDDSEDYQVSIPVTSVLEDNNESLRALKDVQNKLEGNGLSVEAAVQELIQQATDVGNLATIYMGWSPFY
ncbi:LAQU0S03e04412g1_1 [Lachancea quebecensis]|uniref:Serine/threonine-protein kinase Tel1 n=1 Tax=Lachancea quebecensis TaxID=1654605 RepID=A0A0P1KRP0_9SACH|nr:LAQU0S03e04412g1_1 [Lachancea quebecensis]